ncbi:unnamed protein product [Anisakis simplex]|uniref:Protein kish-B n=1 Tax=Anisakis simplex TaxID=6269 RepID=A0A0M3J8Q3_ANISI|nr:unnamed protein product [Anisakis simplex]
MVNLTSYSFDGLLVVALLLICTCAYLKRVPRVSSWLLSEKKGFFGVFYKRSYSDCIQNGGVISSLLQSYNLLGFGGIFLQASVVGVRLHSTVSACCVAAALYILFVRYGFCYEVVNCIVVQVTLPKGTKKKVKKTPPKGPKRGRHVFIAPKNKNFVEQAKVSAEVTKTINEKNEEMVKDRADRDVGRLSNAAKKAAEKN